MITHREMTDAIAELGAVCVRPESVFVGNRADGTRFEEKQPALYARKCDHETCLAVKTFGYPENQVHAEPRWCILPPGAVELLAEDHLTGTVSQKWCTLPGDPVMMPAWWNPERRFVIRVTGLNSAEPWIFDESVWDRQEKDAPAWRGFKSERITADLETGEEVPA